MNNYSKKRKGLKLKSSVFISKVASWSLNKSRRINAISCVTALLLVLTMNFLRISPAVAGNISASAYNFGVGMGIASWHASARHPNDAVSALKYSLEEARQLPANGIPLDTQSLTGLINNPPPGLALHNSIEGLRLKLAAQIRDTSGNHANIYLLGLYIGLAEGHTSTDANWARALGYAHAALKEARTLIVQNLNNSQNGVNLGFDLSLLDKGLTYTQNILYSQYDAYKVVVNLRNSYADFIRRSRLR